MIFSIIKDNKSKIMNNLNNQQNQKATLRKKTILNELNSSLIKQFNV